MTDKSSDDAIDDDDQAPVIHVDHSDEIEPYLVYQDFDLTDSDMALLLEFAMISLMSEDNSLSEKMADMLEAVHPHHAGAFIVRGLRAQAMGDVTEAAEMFITGTQARFKGPEAAALCLNLLHDVGMDDSDTATAIKDVLKETEAGRRYLAEALGDEEDPDDEDDDGPDPRPMALVHSSRE